MQIARDTIVDLSLELDARNFGMRTPAGFTKDLQFAMEVLKEHDAPEHNVRGGTQIHQLPFDLFMGDAIVADLRDKIPSSPVD